MFVPSDPRFDELLRLASEATTTGLKESGRGRWRELVAQLLGSVREEEPGSERRQHLRAAAQLEVSVLSPEEMTSVATSTIGAGGISILIAEQVPVGTVLVLSIKVAGRQVPLLLKAQVAWSRPGELGAAFIDAFQNDRELLEGIAVKAILSATALE